MVETEREMLCERQDEGRLYERRPFDSSRQATYEDTPHTRRDRDWDYDGRE